MLKAFTLILLSFLLYFTGSKPTQKEVNTNYLYEDTVAHDFGNAKVNYANYCAGCHGEYMKSFADQQYSRNRKKEDLTKAIKVGYPDQGMPSFETTFSNEEIGNLVGYIWNAMNDVATYDFAKEEFNPSDTFQSERMIYTLETVLDGLEHPWAMAFLPNDDMLITDRIGALYRLTATKQLQAIANVPDVVAKGQGGLMEVTLHPDFANNRIIYLTYSKQKKLGGKELATTAVHKAKLDGNRLVEGEDIFVALPYSTTRHHYGSRIQFDKAGYLFVSVGDRGNRNRNPQYLDNHCGKIHRLNDDGSIPDDNPFVNEKDAMPTIYSYGHRNPQGVVMDPATGKIWEHEHGPRGGDEINLIEPGVNYGWPTISYGINYNGTSFTHKTQMEDMAQPKIYWVPSIAPCGMTFVTGDRYKPWKGHILTGSLRFKYVNLTTIENDKVTGEEKLLPNVGRVRALEMGNDDYIYVAVESPGAIYKIVPIGETPKGEASR